MMTSARKGSADRTTNYKLWKHQEVINPYYQHLPHLPSPSSLIIRTKIQGVRKGLQREATGYQQQLRFKNVDNLLDRDRV